MVYENPVLSVRISLKSATKKGSDLLGAYANYAENSGTVQLKVFMDTVDKQHVRRRILLSSVGSCCVALSGCLSNDDEDEENVGNEDYDREERHENDGGEDDWSKEFHSGRPLVEVTVDEAFDGDVACKANCRDEEYRIPAGEELSINREEDGESCSFRLLFDNEEVFDGGVSGSAIAYIEVTEEGEVLASEDAI